MRLKKRILLFVIIGLFLGGGDTFAAKKRLQEKLLLKGINQYEAGQLEDAMENFMEVLRVGGTSEEISLSKDYLHRITLKISGRSPNVSIPGLSPQPQSISMPATTSTSSPPTVAQQPSSPVIRQPSSPAVAPQPAPAKPRTPESILATDIEAKQQETPRQDQQGVSVTQETLDEYYQRRFRAGRLGIYEKLKAHANLALILKGQDKIHALRIPYDALFETGSQFKPQAKDLLILLHQAAYYHPEHLIHIYSGYTRGRSTLVDLQRATVLGGYLTNKGIPRERLEIELERAATLGFFSEDPSAPAISRMLETREGALIILFEEFSEPFYLHYFLTKYLPKKVSSKEYPSLSLGVSQERLDARVGEGLVIELFANSNPMALARWSLRVISPHETIVLDLTGKGAVLKSVYFDGKAGLTQSFDLLPSGKYRVEAEALNVAGAKATIARELDILGFEPKKISTPASNEKLKTKRERPKISLTKKGKSRQKKSSKHSVKAASPPFVAPTAASAAATTSSKAGNNHTETQLEPAQASPASLEGEVLTYKIIFGPNENKVPSGQMGVLEKLGQYAKLYPLQRFSLIGQASPEEKNANDLARQRVEKVVETLFSGYGVERSRLNLTWAIGEKNKREVEIFVEE